MAREDAEMVGQGEQSDVAFDEISEECIKGTPIRTEGNKPLGKALWIGSRKVSEVVEGGHEERNPIAYDGNCKDNEPQGPLS